MALTTASVLPLVSEPAPPVQLGQPEHAVEDATALLAALEAGAERSKEAMKKLQQKALYR